MVQRMRFLAAGVAAATLVGAVGAQPPPPVSHTTTTTTTTQIRKATGLMNANVVVNGGTSVGRITDFVISDGGCIDYAVVGTDDHFVLVPYQAIRFDPGQRVVQVAVTQQAWRAIPTFTGTNWPVSDQLYIGRVRSAFGLRESSYRGDRRGDDRRPLDRANDRRDQPTPPQQRRDAENPNRNPPPPRPVDPNRNPPNPPTPDRPVTPPDRPVTPVVPPPRPQPTDRPGTPPPARG